MLNDPLITRIFNATTGIWTLVAVACSSALVAWVRSRPSLRQRDNERRRDVAIEKANDFQRLREEVGRLAERVEALERKVDECEEERDKERERANLAEAEVIRLKAFYEGVGEARQHAQMIVSTEREKNGDVK